LGGGHQGKTAKGFCFPTRQAPTGRFFIFLNFGAGQKRAKPQSGNTQAGLRVEARSIKEALGIEEKSGEKQT